ncbi:MAG: hypothetical protein D6805_01720 [Planctomycetota bacterium]|nr:MAG: hypothetical protein D6805_01720 [Planctomycetota bacterium]
MSSQEDILFAKIAIKNNLVKQEQIEKCLEVQKKLQKAGKEKKLSEILQEIGFLKPDQVEKIEAAQQRSKNIQESQSFLQKALENKIISKEVSDQCLQVAKQEGFRRPIQEILVEHGYLSSSQVLQIQGNSLEVVPREENTSSSVGEKSKTTARPSIKVRAKEGRFPTLPAVSSPSSAREEAFEMASYIKIRRRREKFLYAFLVFIMIFILGAFSGLGYLAYHNDSVFDRASELFASGDYGKALEYLQKMQGTFWVGKKKVENLKKEILFSKEFSEAYRLLKEGKYSLARERFLGLKEKFPSQKERIQNAILRVHFEELIRQSDLSFQEGDFKRSILLLKKAHKMNIEPSLTEKSLRELSQNIMDRARFYIKRGSYPQALALLELLREQFSLNVMEDMEKAKLLQKFEQLLQKAYAPGADYALIWDRLRGMEEALFSQGRQKEVEELKKFLRRKVQSLRYEKALSVYESYLQSYREAREREAVVAQARTLLRKLASVKRVLQEVKEISSTSLQMEIETKIQKLARIRSEILKLLKRDRDLREVVHLLKQSKIKSARQVLSRLRLSYGQMREVQILWSFSKKLSNMIYIPPGAFVRGSSKKGERWPGQKQNIRGFYIDKYEVTNQEFKVFVDQEGYKTPKYWPGMDPRFFAYFRDQEGKLGPGHWRGGTFPAEKGKHPVVFVSWYEARAFAIFRGKRLPTEAQWEKAARGVQGNRYPWGNTFSKGPCNMGSPLYGDTKPVGSYPKDRSPYGVFDMAGNVKEWVRDRYYAYPQQRPVERYLKGDYRMVKGGGWNTPKSKAPHVARGAYRSVLEATQRLNNLGFRCVVEIPGEVEMLFQRYGRKN